MPLLTKNISELKLIGKIERPKPESNYKKWSKKTEQKSYLRSILKSLGL